jgi:hypothetical protein
MGSTCFSATRRSYRRHPTDEQDEAAALGSGLVGADAADERRVLAGGLQRGRDVGELDPGCARQDLGRTLGRQRTLELGVHRDGVSGEHGDAHARAGDEQVGELEDLPALVPELLLLVGLAHAVLDDAAGERHDIEGDRADVLDRLGERHGGSVVRQRSGVLLECGLCLAQEFLDPGEPGTRDRLVGRRDQTAEAGLGVEHLEHRHDRHGRAVRVRDDALRRLVDGVRVHLAHDERDVGVHAPGAGVVDDERPGCGELRREGPRGGGPGGEQRDVDAGRVGELGVLDHDLLAAERQRRTGGTGAREEADPVGRERALFEQATHHGADLAGGADDGDGEGAHAVLLVVQRVRRLQRPVPA